MPCYIREWTPDGLRPVAYTADSLADAARYEPADGVYTVANTVDTTRVLKIEAHLDRMENSARLAGIPLRLDHAALRAALRQVILDSGFGDVRYRITVPRAAPDHILLSVEPFTPPPAALYRDGVRVVTVPDVTRHDPAAKTTDWMLDRESVRATFPPGIYEGLLLDPDGHILEGLTSNFYAVLNRTLRTAGEGVLPGIARQIVFAVAPAIIPVDPRPVHILDLPTLDEAFLTSSSRGIVPIVEIDGVQIGDGAPGPNTLALREAYLAWVVANLEEL